MRNLCDGRKKQRHFDEKWDKEQKTEKKKP